MYTLQTVEAIIEYYARNRGVGHTTAMIDGAKNTDGAIVLVHDYYNAAELKHKFPKLKAICATGPMEVLYGISAPLLIDHYVLTGLFYLLLSHINGLGKQVEDVKREIFGLNMLIDHKNNILEKEHKEKIALQNALKELIRLINIYEILNDFDEDDTDLADAVKVAESLLQGC